MHEPTSVAELQQLVKELSSQKALGSTHCFNNIADSPANQISTKNLNRIISIDSMEKTVTVEAGIRYGELAPELDKKGYALHNLASLPHISIAGACATATHGSGVGNGNLATGVRSIDLIKADGELLRINREDPLFSGAIVNLGALGIIARLSLDLQKGFQVRQEVFQELPLQSFLANFDEILSSGYSVSLFTNWQNDTISQVWVKRRIDEDLPELGTDFYGATAATKDLHPITALSAENCTAQMGIEGPWHDRLPHFKMGFTPSSGEELQSEYFVPAAFGKEAFSALVKLKDVIYPELFISEIRTVAADQLWLSPAYQKDCLVFHFTWKPNWPGVQKILPQIEKALDPYGVVPHWGKLFKIPAKKLFSRYEKMSNFIELAHELDPEGKFRNAYLDLNLFTKG